MENHTAIQICRTQPPPKHLTVLFTGLLLTGLLTCQPALADTQVFSSGKQPVMLVELYTSQGCSSCPPAEAWLSDLKNAPGLWKNIVPVAFHVDYWNHLGWKDTWSAPAYSARQTRYRADGNIRIVYTPGFVVDGREWRNWFNNRQLPQAKDISDELSVKLNDKNISASYPVPAASTDPLQLNLAILAMGVKSKINAGENHGKNLAEDFVVLAHSQIESTNGRWQTQLPDFQNPAQYRLALAVWVNRLTDLTPLQATGGWLNLK